MSPLRAETDSDSKLYRSISEVSELVGVKPHVLRYWETQFGMLRPRKNRAGNRMYRPDEVRLLMEIKELLYQRRFTIAGARRRLLDERHEPAAATPSAPKPPDAHARKLALHEVTTELRQLLSKLRSGR